MLGTYGLHTIHHTNIYIQYYNCNNLFMHKGQDQVNIVEVYTNSKSALAYELSIVPDLSSSLLFKHIFLYKIPAYKAV